MIVMVSQLTYLAHHDGVVAPAGGEHGEKVCDRLAGHENRRTQEEDNFVRGHEEVRVVPGLGQLFLDVGEGGKWS